MWAHTMPGWTASKLEKGLKRERADVKREPGKADHVVLICSYMVLYICNCLILFVWVFNGFHMFASVLICLQLFTFFTCVAQWLLLFLYVLYCFIMMFFKEVFIMFHFALLGSTKVAHVLLVTISAIHFIDFVSASWCSMMSPWVIMSDHVIVCFELFWYVLNNFA